MGQGVTSENIQETRVALVGGTGEVRQRLRARLGSVTGVRFVWDAADVAKIPAALESLPEFLFIVPDRSAQAVGLLEKIDCESVHVIVVLESAMGPEALEAVRRGARGIMAPDLAPTMMARLIRCVREGELWAGRDVLKQVLESARTRMKGPAAFSRAYDPERGLNGSDKGPGKGPGLTARELEIVRHVVDGRTNREIARLFSISENTVKFHLRGVYEKTGVHNRLELAVFAAHHALVPPAPRAGGNAAQS